MCKYVPVAAVMAVLYGGKQLKDYMAGEEEEKKAIQLLIIIIMVMMNLLLKHQF